MSALLNRIIGIGLLWLTFLIGIQSAEVRAPTEELRWPSVVDVEFVDNPRYIGAISNNGEYMVGGYNGLWSQKTQSYIDFFDNVS